MLRRIALPLFVLLATTLPVGTAWACSCAMQTAEEFVAAADGPVFVGTLADREPLDGGDGLGQGGGGFGMEVRWSFEVERVLVGELPETVEFVAVAGDGGNCGLMLDPGARVGLKLFPEGDGWTSNSCLTQDADALLAVTDGDPPSTEPGSPPTDASGELPAGDAPWLGLALTVAAGVAVLGGTVLVARRRRPGS